jgi:hypothetical protein
MKRILVIAALSLLSSAGLVQAGAQPPAKARVQTNAQPMSDAVLDQVTAGSISAGLSDGVVRFQGSTPTPNGLVSADGSLGILTAPLGSSSTTQGTLNIAGNAQQNLSSLVNINAVNSVVNVLLNLNINMNSTVGTLTQSNLNGKP